MYEDYRQVERTLAGMAPSAGEQCSAGDAFDARHAAICFGASEAERQ